MEIEQSGERRSPAPRWVFVAVAAVLASIVPIFIHGVTDQGVAAPGTYRLVIPLDAASELAVTVGLTAVACRQGPATTMMGAPGGGEVTCEVR